MQYIASILKMTTSQYYVYSPYLPSQPLSISVGSYHGNSENEGSGLKLSLSDFLPLRHRLTDGSIVDSQVIRNLFQRVPISNVSAEYIGTYIFYMTYELRTFL